MLDKDNLPKHVAIIMDGNGRWAKSKGLPRTVGHREGIKRVKEIVRAAAEIGLQAITFYAFSAENWERPKTEVSALMRFFEHFLGGEVDELHKNNIRFLVIGRDEPIPISLQKKIREAELKTGANTGLTMVLAVNYGSRQEIVDAAKKFSGQVLRQEIGLDELDTNNFGNYLYTFGLPDPDMLIRTSGEMRISNFLLWQLSYAEFIFSKKCWPEFKRDDFLEAIEEYQKRERRFGRVGADKKNH
jgi:undecaprenyl diphosphate synthase